MKKQIDFSRFFKQKKYNQVTYKLREGVNKKHDLIFLDSYIHDAILFLDNIVLKKGTLTIPLERICWELEDSNFETHSCLSNISIYNVRDYFFSFNKNLLEGWNLPTKVNISDFSLLDSDKDSIFKFSLFIKDELPEFQMTIIAARKGNILTLKDEINSFN